MTDIKTGAPSIDPDIVNMVDLNNKVKALLLCNEAHEKEIISLNNKVYVLEQKMNVVLPEVN